MNFSRRMAQAGLIATIAILVLGMTVVFIGSTEGGPQPTQQTNNLVVANTSHSTVAVAAQH